FFQAEDGIRDPLVTGVQTCALPIWKRPVQSAAKPAAAAPITTWFSPTTETSARVSAPGRSAVISLHLPGLSLATGAAAGVRREASARWRHRQWSGSLARISAAGPAANTSIQPTDLVSGGISSNVIMHSPPSECRRAGQA